jgi:hypothetical protein
LVVSLLKRISSMSIRSRAAITVLVAIACGLSYVLVSLNTAYRSNLRMQSEEAVMHAESAFEVVKALDTAKLAATAEAIASRPDVVNALRSQDASALLELTAPLLDSLRTDNGISHLYFISPEGRVILRVHEPSVRGDVLDRATFLDARRTGEVASGLEVGQTAFALRHVRPVSAPETLNPSGRSQRAGHVLGYVELAQDIHDYLMLMARHTGDDYALLLAKDHLDRASWASMRRLAGQRDDWDDHGEHVLVASTTSREAAHI